MAEHYIVLSRKYRPKLLSDLIGQDTLSSSLKSCLDAKKVPHAFLFHGIRGVGKTTTARILARCLSCLGIDGLTDITSTPCGVCKSCIAIDSDQHMDIMEFDAASRTGVDDIREIIDATQYAPIQGRYKIFIIDEVHMLSKSAFNALLKTLEEPPTHVKFIFATTELNKIQETILSRCMTYQLKPITHDVLSLYLINICEKEGILLEKDAASIVAEESEGSVRDALSIIEQAIMSLGDAKTINVDIVTKLLGSARICEIKALLNHILLGKTEEAIKISESLIQNNADPFAIYKQLQTMLYKIIVDTAKNKNSEYNLSNLLYLWQIFLKQTETIKNSTHPEFILNAAIVIMAHTASFPKIDSLMIKDTENNVINTQSTNNQSKLASKLESIMGEKVQPLNDQKSKLIENVLEKFPGATITEIE